MSKATTPRTGPLEVYRAKRDFALTPEPAGSPEAAGAARRGGRFVVQRHRARRLHYDLRLEIDGVLVSWAVPKGPTLDPSVRHLAVHVEDHPLDYFDFEGVIPEGQYGGGDVIVWDWGTWTPARDGDPAGAIEAGELHFDLQGEKLAGRFVLIRRDDKPPGKEQWLLLHKKDEHAQAGWDPEQHLRSVKTGRTNDEVAAEARPRQRRSRRRAPKQPGAPDVAAPTPSELEALEALGSSGEWEVGGCRLRLTNLDKVLFPGREAEEPVTKRDLIRYHATIAPVMVPYLADRPINLHRYPNGSDRPGFWHKEVPEHAPEWLRRWHNVEADPGETQWYFVVDNAPALAWMANYGAIELHPWTSTIGSPHEPTWAFIDIDPGPQTSFEDVLLLARLYRTALDHLDVVGLPKVTGQRGVQIWVPIRPGYSFDDTRAWVEGVSRAVGATVPDMVSWAWQKKDRGGRARLDYTQNAINKTLVAPYSARPAPGAPVSVPLEWDELDDPELRPDRWTVRTVVERVETDGDPFRRLLGLGQDLPSL